MRRLFRSFLEGSAGEASDESGGRSGPSTGTQDIPTTTESAMATDADRVPSLRTRLLRIASMSGAKFERFMADVFEALGYDVTLVGGAGDQGVDLVVRKGTEVVAVQCKNYRQPVGNRRVQEVYAGARHHPAPLAGLANIRPAAPQADNTSGRV